MKRLIPTSVATTVCGLLGAAPAWSAAYTFTTLTIPGAPAGSFQFAASVNDLNQAIVTAEAPGVTFNFTAVDDIYNLGTKTYTPIPPPILALTTVPRRSASTIPDRSSVFIIPCRQSNRAGRAFLSRVAASQR